MTAELEAPVIPTTIPGVTTLIVYLSVDCNKISSAGKAFRWPRPSQCPNCWGLRLWGHGYVSRYFDGQPEMLWMKRWRCPECAAVHTSRPIEYWRGFWAQAATIYASLRERIENRRWLQELPRQRQEYWWKGFGITQLVRGAHVDVELLLSSNLIVATHSLSYREICYAGEPPHRIFAFTPPVRAP
jgi:hypothetical protein